MWVLQNKLIQDSEIVIYIGKETHAAYRKLKKRSTKEVHLVDYQNLGELKKIGLMGKKVYMTGSQHERDVTLLIEIASFLESYLREIKNFGLQLVHEGNQPPHDQHREGGNEPPC